jgi:rubrerythrin
MGGILLIFHEAGNSADSFAGEQASKDHVLLRAKVSLKKEGDQPMATAEEYLKEAFAGESQANRKYLAFADKADQDGYPQAARLLRAAAAAETVHAHNHLRALNGINSSTENLKEAIAGETHEFKSMYPEMLEQAKTEGHKNAERTFQFALEVEKVHGALYQGMLDNLEAAGKENFPYYVCPVCGYTSEREAPESCPVCGTKGSMFKKVD